MDTWRTYDIVIDNTNIRLETLDRDSKIAGWIVHRACNVFHAYLPPSCLPIPEDGLAHDAVVDLLTDGRMIGQAVSDQFGDLPGLPLGLPGEHQGDVRGQVAVARIPRRLDRDSGRIEVSG